MTFEAEPVQPSSLDPIDMLPRDGGVVRVLGMQYLTGAAVILIAIALPAADHTDRPYLGALAGLGAILGAVLLTGRFSGPRAVANAITVLIGLVTVAVGVSRPMGLAPLFYFWPLMLSAYYASATRLWVNASLAIVSFGVALATVAETDNAPLAFVEFAAIAFLVVTAIRRLRERIVQLFDQLQFVAAHDGLTKALNRTAFEERFEAMRAADVAGPAALLMIDVDHFKAINDRYGHGAGDAALVRLATLVRAEHPGDLFGRVGGEEFALVLLGKRALRAPEIADRLCRAVELQTAAHEVAMTVSIGVAATGQFADPWTAADEALYVAKARGRNQMVVATPDERRRSEPSLLTRHHPSASEVEPPAGDIARVTPAR